MATGAGITQIPEAVNVIAFFAAKERVQLHCAIKAGRAILGDRNKSRPLDLNTNSVGWRGAAFFPILPGYRAGAA
jgi:hypothetical protein